MQMPGCQLLEHGQGLCVGPEPSGHWKPKKAIARRIDRLLENFFDGHDLVLDPALSDTAGIMDGASAVGSVREEQMRSAGFGESGPLPVVW